MDKNTRIAYLTAQLVLTDYVVIKIAEGRASKEDYADTLEQREKWREEIRSLREENSQT